MKIYHLGRRIDGRFDSLRLKIKRFFLWWGKIFVGVTVVVSFFLIHGGVAEVSVQKVEAESNIAPVLQRIAKCESGDNHYDKNGQVLMRSNSNKTVDVGKYQINSVWFAKATELGLDITKEQDNETMARWIYENRGTGDWSATANCWKK